MTERLPDLAKLLLSSWKLALRAERKSPATVKSYAEGVLRVHALVRDARAHRAELTKTNAQAFVADLLDNGAQPKTASARLLRHQTLLGIGWPSEGELDADPLLGMKQPKVDTQGGRGADRRGTA